MNDDDRELDARIRQLPRSIDPPTDLWPGIAARIESRGRSRFVWPGVLAAAALVLLWGGTRGGEQTPSPQRGWDRSALAIAPPSPEPAVAPVVAPAAAPAIAPAVAPAAAPVELFPGEDHLRAAAGELTDAYAQRRPLLGQDLLAVYDSNLGIVDDAIERSRAALVDRPEDPKLQRALDRAYRHKLSLLRRASAGGER